jgi:hypothetical protein
VTHQAPEVPLAPDVRFYLVGNPGHVKGGMLFYLVPVTFDANGRAIT